MNKLFKLISIVPAFLSLTSFSLKPNIVIKEQLLTKEASAYLNNNEKNSVISFKKYETEVYSESENFVYKVGDKIYQEFTEREGYIRFITFVYYLGIDNGSYSFKVHTTAKVLKDFFINKKDQLAIATSYNAIYNNDNDGLSGYYNVDCEYYSGGHYQEEIYPKTYFTNGVTYEHSIINKDNYESKNHSISGSYYFLTTGDSSVNNYYIHNQSLYLSSLGVNIGNASISVNASNIDYKIFSAETITVRISDFEK